MKVTNTGLTAGKEIVQLYVAPKDSTVIRPLKELKGFEKVSLEPGEAKEVQFKLDKRSFAYYNTAIHDWYVEAGCYEIMIGKSSRDIAAAAQVQVEATIRLPQKYSVNSTFGDISADPRAKELAQNIIDTYQELNGNSDSDVLGESTSDMMAAMFQDTPLRAALLFSTGSIKEEEILKLVEELNKLED